MIHEGLKLYCSMIYDTAIIKIDSWMRERDIGRAWRSLSADLLHSPSHQVSCGANSSLAMKMQYMCAVLLLREADQRLVSQVFIGIQSHRHSLPSRYQSSRLPEVKQMQFKAHCHLLLQEIFPIQGSDLGLLHCSQILDGS